MTWLNAVVRNQALDLLRKHKRHQGHDSSDEALDQLVDTAANQAQDQQGIHVCLAQLKEQQRQCIQLAYYEGLAHPQVAAQLNFPLGSVKAWIRRGLLGLRECLKHTI
ncbi:MAG: sigma-70 family RNA polymerase sigma factor [Oceanospirillaceae bacterium]|jgi:RNA polymerase sigma-70 factor (ECF subfamily)|nr:sigma-70 family RNA polymerase sigma factor [Oceanospirillaceae bacterium]